MNVITLPPDRYPELSILGFLKHLPNPATSRVVVAQDDDGVIKAFWVAQATMHIEPVYLDDSIRDGGRTGLKMLAQLLTELVAAGEAQFFAFADTEEVASYLTRLGLEQIPYVIYRGLNPLLQKVD